MSWFKPKPKYRKIKRKMFYYKHPSEYIVKLYPKTSIQKKEIEAYVNKFNPREVMPEFAWEPLPDTIKYRYEKRKLEIYTGYWTIYKRGFDYSDNMGDLFKKYADMVSQDDNLDIHGDFGYGAIASYTIGSGAIGKKYKRSKYPIYPELEEKGIYLIYQGSLLEEPIKNSDGMYVGIGDINGNIRTGSPHIKFKFPSINYGSFYVNEDNKFQIISSEELLEEIEFDLDVADWDDGKDELSFFKNRNTGPLYHPHDIVDINFLDELMEMKVKKRENNIDKLLQ